MGPCRGEVPGLPTDMVGGLGGALEEGGEGLRRTEVHFSHFREDGVKVREKGFF